MSNQTNTVRLQVRLTVTTGLKSALDRKARALHISERDAIHQAIVEWVARPVTPAAAPAPAPRPSALPMPYPAPALKEAA